MSKLSELVINREQQVIQWDMLPVQSSVKGNVWVHFTLHGVLGNEEPDVTHLMSRISKNKDRHVQKSSMNVLFHIIFHQPELKAPQPVKHSADDWRKKFTTFNKLPKSCVRAEKPPTSIDCLVSRHPAIYTSASKQV